MRTLIVTAIVLASFGPAPSLAQDIGTAPLTEQQPEPEPVQGGSKPPAQVDSQANDEANKRRVMERQGPGIDWDHRKPGRDWKMSPRREDGAGER